MQHVLTMVRPVAALMTTSMMSKLCMHILQMFLSSFMETCCGMNTLPHDVVGAPLLVSLPVGSGASVGVRAVSKVKAKCLVKATSLANLPTLIWRHSSKAQAAHKYYQLPQEGGVQAMPLIARVAITT